MPDNPFARDPSPPDAPGSSAADDPGSSSASNPFESTSASAAASAPVTVSRGLPIPSTFRGIASLAAMGGWRLSFWQWITAAIIALMLTWSLFETWGTSIDRATVELPEAGKIERGVMSGIDTFPRILSSSSFLAIILDPEGFRDSGVSSDVLVSLERDRVAARSVLGWMSVRYPDSLSLPLDRLGLASLWEAWKSPAWMACSLILFGALLISWTLLAAVYTPVIWILSGSVSRPMSVRHSWRLAAASLIPAGLLLGCATVLYATHQLGLIGLLLAWPTHLVVGWVFCAGGLLRTPRARVVQPFAEATALRNRPRSRNPFRES